MVDKPAGYLITHNFYASQFSAIPLTNVDKKRGFVETPLYEAPPARRVTELLEANNRLVEERRAIKADRDKLALIVKACAVQFRYYETQHRAKQTHDGDMKAKTNADFASICENATK